MSSSADPAPVNNFVTLSALLGAQCAQCGKRSVTLCQCPCRKAYYCDVGCQRSHWQSHKDVCTKAQRNVAARLNRCASCGSLSNVLKICGCGSVYYCSLDCQKKHYGVHRRICTLHSNQAGGGGVLGGNGKGLNSGAMLSAFGDDAAGVEGTATISTQTEETCTELLTTQQERLKAEAAARNKFLHERRRSSAAQQKLNRASTAVSAANKFNFHGGVGDNSQNPVEIHNTNELNISTSSANNNNNNNNNSVTFLEELENKKCQHFRPHDIPSVVVVNSDQQDFYDDNDDDDDDDKEEVRERKPQESNPSPVTRALGSFRTVE